MGVKSLDYSHWLNGGRLPCKLFTDHRNLLALFADEARPRRALATGGVKRGAPGSGTETEAAKAGGGSEVVAMARANVEWPRRG